MEPIPLEQRLRDMLELAPALESLDVTLLEARGCRLAEDIATDHSWPHFTSATVDGYAARSEDTRPGTRLEVIGQVEAGSNAEAAVGPGKVIGIQSGARLPAVADVVLPASAVAVVDDSHIQVRNRVQSGSGVLQEGSYAPKGRLLVPKGERIDERLVGVLASLGRSRVSVIPRPRVVIVSVGDGLVSDGAPPSLGCLYDATNIMLASATMAANAQPYRMGPIAEDPQLIADTLDDQLVRADVIVVCGGIASESDCVRQVLTRIGKVSYDEGSTSLSAFGSGTLGEEKTPVISLPSDPVEAFMLFRVLVNPLLASMLGRPRPPLSRVSLAVDVPRIANRTQILLASVDPAGRAAPLSGGGVNALSLHSADAMIQILPGDGVESRGSTVVAQALEPQAESG